MINSLIRDQDWQTLEIQNNENSTFFVNPGHLACRKSASRAGEYWNLFLEQIVYRMWILYNNRKEG